MYRKTFWLWLCATAAISIGISQCDWRTADVGEIRRRDRILSNLGRASSRELEESVRIIGSMLAKAPNDPTLYSSLAGLYLERAEVADDPRDLIRALESAETALEADNLLKEARFCRARALTGLALRKEGLSAWDDYLAVEHEPSRREKATQLKIALFAAGTKTRQAVEEELIDLVRSRGDVASFTRANLSIAQAFGLEKAVGRLGNSIVDENSVESDQWLALIVDIGAVIQKETGDRFLHDVALSLQKAAREPRLGQALLDFSQGADLYDSRRIAEARLKMTSVLETLRTEVPPLAEWTEFLLLSCAYFEGQENLEEKLRSFGRKMEGRRYHVLRGYNEWLLGLFLTGKGRIDEGRAFYASALNHFRTARCSDAEGFLSLLLSNTEATRGSSLESWRHLLAAMKSTPQFRKIGHVQAVWRAAAGKSLDLSARRSARILADRAVAEAMRSASAVPIAEAFQSRAAIRNMLNDPVGASRDFSALGDWLARLPRSGTERTQGLVLAARALHLPGRGVDAKLSDLEHAIEIFRKKEARVLLPELLIEQAKLQKSQWRFEQAEVSLQEAAGLFESRDLGQVSVEQGGSLLEARRAIYELWLELRIDAGSSPMALLEIIEDFSKARVYSESRLLDLVAKIPADTAFISYFALPEKLVIGVVYGNQVVVHIEEADREDLNRSIRALSSSLSQASVQSYQRKAAEVWKRMVAPIAAEITAQTRWIIQVDPFLETIPLAALRSLEGRSLIEDHTVESTPRFPALATTKSRLGTGRALILGNPTFDHREFPLSEGFEDLPGADLEARRVAEIYSQPTVLLHESATVEALLRGLAEEPDVLHIASHLAWRSRTTDLPQLVLAGTGGKSSISSDELGRVVSKAPPLVYLAACDSAVRGVTTGKRYPSMAETFLNRGASAVVGSTIRLNDSQSVEFAVAFHRSNRSASPPRKIMRDIQLRMQNRYAEVPPWWGALQVQSETILLEER